MRAANWACERPRVTCQGPGSVVIRRFSVTSRKAGNRSREGVSMTRSGEGSTVLETVSRSQVFRMVTTAAALLGTVLAASAPIPTAVAAPRPSCIEPGAVLAYFVGDDWWANTTLVICADRSATIVWWGLTNPHGRAAEHKNLVLTARTWAALMVELGRLDMQRLGPPARGWPPCCDRTFAALTYKAKTIPRDGTPRSKESQRALQRAETILRNIMKRHSPLYH